MDIRSFGPEAPGRLVKTLSGHWAFEPNPLPPAGLGHYQLPLVNILTRAATNLGRLKELGGRLPHPQRLIRMFMRREAEASSKIEQTFASVRSLLLYENVTEAGNAEPSVIEVSNNFQVLMLAFKIVEERNLTLADLRALHARLFEDVPNPPRVVGDFRHVQNMIGSTGHISEATYVPPPPTSVRPLLEQLLDYMRTADLESPLIRAAMVHYQFEAIHPFDDGNGRLGRALILAQLVREGLLVHPTLNPSARLERNRRAYYDALLGVSRRGDWTGWFELFVGAIADEAEVAIRRVHALEALREEYRETIRAAGRGPRLVDLAERLIGEPIVNGSQVAGLFGITVAGGIQMLRRLESLGIVSEITGRARNRIWAADKVLKLFELSSEPSEVRA